MVIGGNGDSIYVRLMTAVGREDLANDPDLWSNAGRVEQQQLIDAAIGGWTSAHDSAKVIAILEEADVPVGPIYSIADAFNDPHYQARGLFEEVDTPNGKLKVPAILPKMSLTRGEPLGQAVKWVAIQMKYCCPPASSRRLWKATQQWRHLNAALSAAAIFF